MATSSHEREAFQNMVTTELRSQMKHETLDSKVMIFVERELTFQINAENKIDAFKSVCPSARHLEL